MPWQDHLFSSVNPKAKDVLYVVFPSIREGYNVQAVPDKPEGFGQRKALPESWAGLRGEEFAKKCGVEKAIFCHPARFICGASTLEDAVRLAIKAVRA